MITREEVEHIAKLARITLTQEEVEKFQKEFSEVLAYFDTLKSLQISDIEPMTHSITLRNVMREDEEKKETKKNVENLIAMTKNIKDGFVKVSEILKEK